MKGSELMVEVKNVLRLVFIMFLFFGVIIVILIKKNLTNEQYHDIEVLDDNTLVKVEETDVEDTSCTVDIKGAVKEPGVYVTNCLDTISDIIRLAGGLTDDADTSVTNLAKKITNEMVVIIYTKEEVKNSNVVDTVVKVVEQECICPNIQNDGCLNTEITETIGDNKLININTASVEELKKIPGIGDAKAKSIVEYREKFGKFKTTEDIMNVSGIGNNLYEAIKTYITT